MSISCEDAAERRGVVVLGATGSVGMQTLEVLSHLRGQFRLEALTCGHDGEALESLAIRHGARHWFCAASPAHSNLDDAGLRDLLQSDRVAIVVCAIQGIAALPYVVAALEAGKRVCLATKEVMVVAGEWINELCQAHGGEILPVDSEHCAIFQCLQGERRDSVKSLWLTCSGGPFHDHPEIDLHAVTPEQALRHPTWNMGKGITLDCASLMNKGLEMIEARWLFRVRPEQVQVVIHPQSVVHSMVEFTDGAVLSQMATTSMRLPIQYCLCYPERSETRIVAPLDFRAQKQEMTFLPPDETRFPALSVARKAMRLCGGAGAVFQAANEAARERFLTHTLAFDEIPLAVDAALEGVSSPTAPHSLEEAQHIWQATREFVGNR